MVCSLVRGEYEVISPNTQPTKEICYHIASPDFNGFPAKEIADHMRGHWEIEDRRHWQQKDTLRSRPVRLSAGGVASVQTTSRRSLDFDAVTLTACCTLRWRDFFVTFIPESRLVL